MPTVYLSVLGPPLVEVDGRSVSFRSRKVLALLVYLTLERGPHARELLAELLWPEHARDARGALRNAVFHLRAALGEASVLLRVDRDHVQLIRPNGADVAVRVDMDALYASDVTAALLTVWRGGFLESSCLVDGARWNEWAQARDREARDAFSMALARLVASSLQAEDHAGALLAARRRVQLDPLHEDAYRTLMRAQRHAGDHGGVFDTFRQCRDVLERELQARPAASTLALLRHPAAVPRGTPDESSPVGRADHVRTASRALHEGRLVLLSGPSGIGKSHLTRALTARYGRTLALEGRMTDQSVPFAVVSRAVRRIVDDEGPRAVPAPARAELARLIPDVLPDAAANSAAPVARLRLFDAITSAFATAARPDVMVLEDVHAWDPDSVQACLHALGVLAARTPPVGAVLTYRTGALPGEIERLIRAFVTARQAEAIEVGPLNRDDLTVIVSGALQLDGRTSADVTARLHDLAAGNPLFMLELCRAWLDDVTGVGTTRDDPGRSVRVRAAVRARLAGCAPLGQRLLQLAAVADADFTASLAAQVLDTADVDLADAFDQLREAGALLGARFTHDLIQEVTLEAMPNATREVLHARLHAELSAAGASAATLARHALGAKHWKEAVRALVAAGDDARRVLAMEQAFVFHEQAWNLLSIRGGPVDPRVLDPEVVRRLAYVMLVNLADRGVQSEVDDVIRDMRTLGRMLNSIPLEVLAACQAALHEGERERTVWNTQRALQDAWTVAVAARDVSSIAWIRNTLAHPSFSRWTLSRALNFARDTVQQARAERFMTDTPGGLMEALEFLGTLELNAGQYSAALACFAELRDITPRRYRITHARAQLGEGRTHLALGNTDQAMLNLRGALAVFEATPARSWRFEAAAALTLAHLDAGDIEAAANVAADHARVADDPRTAWTGRVTLDYARAVTAWHARDVPRARTYATRVRKRALACGARYPAWQVYVPAAESVLCAALHALRDPDAALLAASAASYWSSPAAALTHPVSLHVPVEAEVAVVWQTGRPDLAQARLRSLTRAAETCAAEAAPRLRATLATATRAVTPLKIHANRHGPLDHTAPSGSHDEPSSGAATHPRPRRT